MIKFIKRVFRTSNKIRIAIINTLFWLVVILFFYFLNSGETDVVTGDTLYVQFSGNVTQSPTEGDLLTIITSDNFEVPKNTVLRDVLNSILLASKDKKIKNMVLDLDYLSYIGLASSEEIGIALNHFRDSGKEIFAFSSYYNRGQYYLASFATEVSMDPYGEVNIEGISVYRNYWKNALDKYDVDVQIFRAGEYKSYVEPYISSSMSKDVKDQNLLWMNSIWNNYLSDIGNNRDLSSLTLDTYFNSRLEMLTKYEGDSSLLAKGEGFVNHIETRQEFFSKFASLYHYLDYQTKNNTSSAKSKIAVITLEGTITYSDNNTGSISALDTEIILDDVLTENMDGLLLVINSGGGGVFASEVIRRKVQEIGKQIPVVISMGDVCASGGYWIATAGDEIFANHNSITGSIGVFGMLFGLEKTLENNLGIFTDGVSTTPELEPISLINNINPKVGGIIQLGVENTYNRFLNLVAESRDMDLNYLSSIAEGRVWSGDQALENGLVDTIGGIYQAKDFFGENVELIYMDSQMPLPNRVMNTIFGVTKIPEVKILEELNLFEKISDPKNIYALWY